MAIQFLQQIAIDEVSGTLFDAVAEKPIYGGVTTAQIQTLMSGAWNSSNLRRVLALGTSITGKWGDTGAVGSLRQTNGNSYLFWLTVSLRGGISLVINAGVSGNTSSQMVARYDSDVAGQYANFDALIFEPGPNDYPAGLSASAVQNNIATIVTKAIAAGKTVILLTPTITDGSSSAQNAVQQVVRQWIILTYGAVANVVVIDVAMLMTDPVSGLPISSLYVPTSIEPTRVHPSVSGAQVMGRAIADAVALKPTTALVQSLGSRDHYEYLPNSRLAGNNASAARNFFAGAGVTVTGGPDSFSISIGAGSFASVTIAPVTGTGAELRSNVGGTRISAITAVSARSKVILRVGSSDGTVGGTQYQRHDTSFANATYAVGDHALVGGYADGILTCITGGATGTASVTTPSTYGDTVTVGAAVFMWQKIPAAGDVFVPEIEYEIESQTGGFALWGWTFIYRNPDGSTPERLGDCKFGAFDESASITDGLPGLWMPRRGVLRGLPITLVNPGVSLRHVFTEVHLVFDAAASAVVRIDRATLRRIS